VYRTLLAICFALAAASGVLAQEPGTAYEPVVGQPGKDVVWVPTPPVLVEKMLDMARVTPRDLVVDLGSGDGRIVIAAAKRGARALGVEYNADLVEFSRQAAQKEGVADRAEFVQGDMYEADISQATVLALFLLTENLNRLVPKFLALRPGARIVVNGFQIEGWTPDETGRAEGDCGSWCTAYLYIVPAKVEGTWRLAEGTLKLEQKFQELSGVFVSGTVTRPIKQGQLRGSEIRFTVGDAHYVGRVEGDVMRGEVRGQASGAWSAVRSTGRKTARVPLP
jgi:SAM-dependent methyltransferase